ncbi:MAG TPA: cytochrome d ubiquinol oxidase subunit II [Bryobacteraceae bacterium]|jgi:cytochrome d ubiquinol oxidase subunit II
MIQVIWFCLVAVTIAGYVVLDGFDLGAGAIHLLIAKTPAERKSVLASIGPVWDGNEVWLLAGGGTLYFAFPALYASSFSGFYLPLMMVLWLLILRGVSIEFRNHLDSPVWTPLWDAGFCVSSLLLAVFYGAALGNVIRGVPLNATGDFFLPLWTNFSPGPQPGILDWYTVLIGVLALAALAMHGSLWVRYKTSGELSVRAGGVARGIWWALGFLTLASTAASFSLQRHILANFQDHPWGTVFPLLAIAGFVGMRLHGELAAFLSACAYLVGMLTSAAFGVFPYVLPSVPTPDFGLTVYNAAPAVYGLQVGLAWWIPGMALATGYSVFVYRRFAGKVS